MSSWIMVDVEADGAAVRYADLEEPPQTLPSGWAALLYLYDLR